MLDFVLQNPTRRLDEPTARWILDHLGGETGNVLDLRSPDGRGLVACLLPSGADSVGAELFVMGYRARSKEPAPTTREAGGTEPADDDRIAKVLAWAAARARERGASWLELALAPGLAAFRPGLREGGWSHVYSLLLLAAESLASCRWPELQPPAGRAWTDLTEHNVLSAHECYARALGSVSGATILPIDDFRSLLHDGLWPTRCLERDGRVLAIARVAWWDHLNHVGEVRTIARHPDHAEPKLGRLAVAEALRQLRSGGATSACVEAASNNPLALGLYRSFGFQDQEISEVFRLPLPSGC